MIHDYYSNPVYSTMGYDNYQFDEGCCQHKPRLVVIIDELQEFLSINPCIYSEMQNI